MEIVEQDDRSGPQLRLDGANDRPGPGSHPRIAPVDTPADVEQPERSDDPVLGARRLPVGRPEDARYRPDGSTDDPLGLFELGPDRGDRETAEVPMAPGVISQRSDAGRCPQRVRPEAEPAPDHEARRARVRP